MKADEDRRREAIRIKYEKQQEEERAAWAKFMEAVQIEKERLEEANKTP
jgi:hypothetical protein